jgi:hypothetical protein
MQFGKTFAAVAGMLLTAGTLAAQTATQTVTFQVDAINQISVSGTPSLTINAASAGSAPTAASTTGLTWAITSNQTGSKVTASINSAMPTGVTLSVTMGAPGGATSAGAKQLGTSAVDVVTGITKVMATGLSLGYSLDATAAAGVVTSTTRTVTFTITGGT